MDKITYDYYRIFYYVARYKNLSMAAEMLHSNQPNVTKFMNKLEAQLGCKLMNRSNKGIVLTPEGENLFQHVSIAYISLKEAEAELTDSARLTSGTIHISATETALHGILLETLTKFRKKYPGIRLLITNDSTPEAIRSLKKGMTDLAIVTSPIEISSDIHQTELMEFDEILVTGTNSSLCNKERLTPADLQSIPIVGLGAHTKTYEYYSKLLIDYGIEWHPDIDVATADQILPMIKADLGIGFIPSFMAKQDLSLGLLSQIKIPEISPVRKILLLEEKASLPNNAVKEFKKMLLGIS